MDGLQKGEGTAGKLLKDPALYDDARASIADVRKLVGQHASRTSTTGKGTWASC